MEVIRIQPLLTHHSLSFELFRFFSVQYQTHLHVHQAHLKFQSEYRIKRNSYEMRCLSCPNWQKEIVVKCVACHGTNGQQEIVVKCVACHGTNGQQEIVAKCVAWNATDGQQEIVVKCVACHATNAQIGSKK